MKMKTQLTLAAVVAAGLLASGCSQQMAAQQAVAEVAPVEPIVKTIVDCSKCKPVVKPRPRPAVKKCWHGRNAQGQCNPKPQTRPAPKPRPAPIQRPPVKPYTPPPVQKPRPPVQKCWHGRNAQGKCNPAPIKRPYQPVVPSVKAKGTYKGAIKIDSMMQQYQQ